MWGYTPKTIASIRFHSLPIVSIRNKRFNPDSSLRNPFYNSNNELLNIYFAVTCNRKHILTTFLTTDSNKILSLFSSTGNNA